jgi:hypothetical protein
MAARRDALDDGINRSPEPDHRRTVAVSMSTSAATATTVALGTASMPRGLASRLVAGIAHGGVGVLLVSSVIGIAIAEGIISRGVVKADASDVATLQAFAPLAAIFGVVGVAHVAAGLGILFGSRTAAALGIGLGVLDLVAGVVILAFSAGADDRSVDGTSFAMTFVVLGIVLAVAARAADWNTHGPVED